AWLRAAATTALWLRATSGLSAAVRRADGHWHERPRHCQPDLRLCLPHRRRDLGAHRAQPDQADGAGGPRAGDRRSGDWLFLYWSWAYLRVRLFRLHCHSAEFSWRHHNLPAIPGGLAAPRMTAYDGASLGSESRERV